MSKKWYVLHTYSGYENKVKKNLETRIETMGLENNVFAIESNSYRTNPLVIQGPGAGREVTAAAIQYDLWQICASL